jgi:hypothetical protein
LKGVASITEINAFSAEELSAQAATLMNRISGFKV